MADNVVALQEVRTRKRTQLPDEVASYVRELIISGAVRPGEFLRLEPIADAVGVSNTPVREGLLALRSEGFVRLVPRRGFVVAPFTQQDIRDLFWAQANLAGELAARAATAITGDQLDRLDRNLADYHVALAAGDEQLVAGLGHKFHREVNLAAGAHRLALLLGSMVKHLPNRFYATIEGRIEDAGAAHPVILDALRNHDPDTARAATRRHILDGADRLVETLTARGLWRPPNG